MISPLTETLVLLEKRETRMPAVMDVLSIYNIRDKFTR